MEGRIGFEPQMNQDLQKLHSVLPDVCDRMRMSLEGSFLCKVFALDLECMFHKQVLRPRSSR